MVRNGLAGPADYNLLIVGSGPVGSCMAKLVADQRPDLSILIVEAGPALTLPPGMHITRVPVVERTAVYSGSQGPERGVIRGTQVVAKAGVAPRSALDAAMLAPAGLHFAFPDGSDLPVAASVTAVGGMGTYWGGVTPRPFGSERNDVIVGSDWDRAVACADALLGVGTVFPGTLPGTRIRMELARLMNDAVAPERPVVEQRVAASALGGDQLAVLGPGDILGSARSALEGGGGELLLRANTLCTRLIVQRSRIAGAVVIDRLTGRTDEVRANAVVVAGDTLRTPQLLWASGIRPRALGRHLMDHPIASAVIELRPEMVRTAPGEALAPSISCVPFDEHLHPYHGIFLQGLANLVPGSWVRASGGVVPMHLANLSWLGRTWPRPENRVFFMDDDLDWAGMPAMRVEFQLSAEELVERQGALDIVERLTSAMGTPLAGLEPAYRPLGASLHYMGTVRLGAADDGTSVCNEHSRVWGFENLFVAGNGTIATPTTVNPTLTSVAHAAHAAPVVAEMAADAGC